MKSSIQPSRHLSTILAASYPTAQSAEAYIPSAVVLITSIISSVASPLSTLSNICDIWFNPILQGTHLPHDCARHILTNEPVKSTGQSPGGLAAILLSKSL